MIARKGRARRYCWNYLVSCGLEWVCTGSQYSCWFLACLASPFRNCSDVVGDDGGSIRTLLRNVSRARLCRRWNCCKGQERNSRIAFARELRSQWKLLALAVETPRSRRRLRASSLLFLLRFPSSFPRRLAHHHCAARDLPLPQVSRRPHVRHLPSHLACPPSPAYSPSKAWQARTTSTLDQREEPCEPYLVRTLALLARTFVCRFARSGYRFALLRTCKVV